MTRHPLAARTEHWPPEAREELRERESILWADGLDPAAAEAMVRRSWLAQPAPGPGARRGGAGG